ncbi:MAG: hypothetical protein LBQ68_05055 [Clostridiales bacterium]|jgi:hypothetical protein|nr:hypothetical protein [Clostridiales bacterium]
MMNRVIKLLIFNVVLSFALIVVFSRAFIGLDIKDGALSAAIGVTVIFLCVVLFFSVNYRILVGKKKSTAPAERYQTLDDCINAINVYLRENSKVFSIKLNTIIDQLQRMKRKQEGVKDVLLQKFSEGELSYVKFNEAVVGTEKLLRSGVKNILTRLYAFDEEEYRKAFSPNRKDRVSEAKRALFTEYEQYIITTTEYNEDILFKLDKLILELTKLSDADDIDGMSALHEIDKLISDAKWYK